MAADRLDLLDVARALARGWMTITASFAVAVLGGVGVLVWAAPVWTGRASVVVRDATPLPGALTSELGGAAAGAASALLGGAYRSSVETDVALLASRELVGEVVDSLHLGVVVTSPRGTAPPRVVESVTYGAAFRPLKVRLIAAGTNVRVTARGVDTTVAPGGAARLPGATLRLAATPVVPATLRLYDREDAVGRAVRRLDVERAGAGEVIRVAWPAEDSLSAPAAANLLVQRFLARRRGVDRSVNQRRLEFVTTQLDSINRALDAAVARQRQFNERAESVDLEVSGRAYLESLLRLREQREVLVMEERALASLREALRARTLQPRQLAAYPAFLRSPAINELLGRIGTLEAERVSLREQQRRDDDPRVAGVRASIAALEAELEPLARTYDQSIGQQRAALDAEIASVNDRLAKLPGQVEGAFQLTHDVERLSRTSLALAAQRVELRLATIGEGGEARAVDVAAPQWRRSFPSRPITLLAAGFAGLALGVALVLAGVGVRPAGGASGGASTA